MEHKVCRVDSPEGLSKVAAEIAQRPPDSPKPVLHLRLLYPLTSVDTLSTCRNPDSKVSRDGNRNYRGTLYQEYLKISPLTERWRAVWSSFPIALDTVTFDISLPEPGPGSEKVYWQTKKPIEDGVGLAEMDVITTVLGMATVMNVRSRKQVSFGLVHDYGCMPGLPRNKKATFERLKENLAGLSRRD